MGKSSLVSPSLVSQDDCNTYNKGNLWFDERTEKDYAKCTAKNILFSAKLKEVGIMTQSQVGAGRFYLTFQLFEEPLYKKAFGFRPKLPRDGTIRNGYFSDFIFECKWVA